MPIKETGFFGSHSRVGPLFQGRFKAILHVPTEALRINRYIHLNPVRLLSDRTLLEKVALVQKELPPH
jgi:hypothetical protein